jgi:ribosomal protein L36
MYSAAVNCVVEMQPRVEDGCKLIRNARVIYIACSYGQRNPHRYNVWVFLNFLSSKK